MSLFEDDNYRWRETYFVLFQQADRPTAAAIQSALCELAPRVQVRELRAGERGELESLTLVSPDDFAAMDVSYVCGEEVVEQIREFSQEITDSAMCEEDRRKWSQMVQCDARFDIYHFEQVCNDSDEEDDGFLDPGSLLIVLQRLASLCQGFGLDPQSGTIL